MIKHNTFLAYLKYIRLFIFLLYPLHIMGNEPPIYLKLPMPKGLSMTLVPVCVNASDGLYSWKKIKLGDPAGGFKEYPTTMALGGSFPIEENGKTMWCYYLAKYELSQQQYASIMTPDSPLPQIKKVYPVTDVSWFDAIEFTNRYNQWLFANAKDKLPKFDSSYGFVRLPTEAEWEFAARGGALVSSDVFDQKTPYPVSKLHQYEWFGGSTSSHYKLQPIGGLKPNILGLHDMLGNADEITMSLFQVEYYQGRIGGFVIKGNNYITAKNKIRSSYRAEQPFYRVNKEGLLKPHAKVTLGFRPLLSALVFPSRKVQKGMSEEWDEYRDTLGATTPAALSTSATSAKTSVGAKDAFIYLDRLRKKLKDKGLSDTEIESSLGYLDSSIRDMATIRLKAEEDSSYLWIKVISEQARFIRKETQKLPTMDTLIGIAKSQNNIQKLTQYKKRKKERMLNIEGALTNYSESMRQLGTLSSSAVEKGFVRYLYFLMKHNDTEQVQVLNRVQKHFIEYQKKKRVNLKEWKKDINF